MPYKAPAVADVAAVTAHMETSGTANVGHGMLIPAAPETPFSSKIIQAAQRTIGRFDSKIATQKDNPIAQKALGQKTANSTVTLNETVLDRFVAKTCSRGHLLAAYQRC